MSDEQDTEHMKSIAAMANANGAVVVEVIACTHCTQKSLVWHHWKSVIECFHCHNRISSRVPPLPVPGEVTLEHMTASLQILREQYTTGPLGKWTPESDWSKLDDRTKLLITTNVSAAAAAVLKQVETLAIAFAKQANELRQA